MTPKTLPELRRELGKEAALLDRLPPDDQTRLLDLIRDTRTRQHQEIRAAMDGALDFIPALLRAPVKALFK